MSPKQKLSDFTHEQLKRELIARGAATHARIAAEASFEKLDLGGSLELAPFSSRELAAAMREQQKVIYGTDDRRDLVDVTDVRILANADGVVSLFRASRVHDNGDGTSTVQTAVFGQVNSLCPDEPFFSQPAGAFCTGFLVAPDVVATAGHCVNENNVTSIRFVFGFRMIDAKDARVRIPNADIFVGASVIGRQLTNDASDFCLVRLNRPAQVKRVVEVRRAGKVADKAALYVIGHPSGLPAKFADGANVRANSNAAFFSANLDTYGGNSGSPIFNSATHVVEGILVRGSTDFVPMGACMVSAVCSTNGCEGEDCTRVSEFVSLLG
jgi:secreted trypsin-like serine protease